MPDQPLQVDEIPGSRDGIHIWRLLGPLTLSNVFGFQAKLRADTSRSLILDFTGVPLADSAAIGALVGAYVNPQKGGRTRFLEGVIQRLFKHMRVTRFQTL